MKLGLRLACLVILATTVRAETFSLKDISTDMVYGPFCFSQGTTIGIGDAKWKLERIDRNHNKILAETKNTVITGLDFKKADLSDVILFVSEHTRRLGYGAQDIVISHSAKNPNDRNITISIRDLSLHDLLSVIAEQSGNRWSIRHGVIVFEPSEKTNRRDPYTTIPLGDDELFGLVKVGDEKVLGPFRLRNKELIEAGDANLEVVQSPSEATLIASLKASMIQNLQFRGASAKDVCLFLDETIRRNSKESDKPIRIEKGKEIAGDGNNITCSIQDKTLYDTLGIICEVSGLEWKIDEDKVVFELPNQPASHASGASK